MKPRNAKPPRENGLGKFGCAEPGRPVVSEGSGLNVAERRRLLAGVGQGHTTVEAG